MLLQIPDSAINALGQSTTQLGEKAATALANNPSILIIGILLIGAAIVVFYFLKKLIVNSILGFIAWLGFLFFFGIEPNLIIPSLAVSVIFGLAGIGAIMVLKFFGVI